MQPFKEKDPFPEIGFYSPLMTCPQQAATGQNVNWVATELDGVCGQRIYMCKRILVLEGELGKLYRPLLCALHMYLSLQDTHKASRASFVYVNLKSNTDFSSVFLSELKYLLTRWRNYMNCHWAELQIIWQHVPNKPTNKPGWRRSLAVATNYLLLWQLVFCSAQIADVLRQKSDSAVYS